MKKIYIVLIIFFLCAFPLFCRDITILVIDEDLDIPLEGATVRTRGGSEYKCGKDGKVKIQVPDDRQVLLYTTYPGYETSTITIPLTGSSFTVYMRISGFLQGKELVIEAPKPGTSESKTGRSIAVGEKEIAQTAEIGIIEDVMSTIKLLPGVGYSGLFNAAPSIRGGQPGDMMASLDGFYINNPYFWGGGFSIFDPRMVKSAQLSHGVFSSRYGHTISGLLEITSKEPSPTEIELELGLNTSAANFNLSVPLSGKGGILFMGRVTYYDPVIWAAKELSHSIHELEVINYIRRAPYIRAATISGNYRFTDNLTVSATGFLGMDGGGVSYLNKSKTEKLNSDTNIDFDYVNYQTFLTSSLSWNPRNDMLLKFIVGTGYEDSDLDGKMDYNIYNKKFTDDFYSKYKIPLSLPNDNYEYSQDMYMVQSDSKYNVQGRVDYDWKLSNNFLAAIGLQELFSVSNSKGDQHSSRITKFDRITDEDTKNNIKNLLPPSFCPFLSELYVELPMSEQPNSQNKLITTSGYLLGEFNTAGNRFSAEFGVRMDHFMLLGDGFTLQSTPVFNPRLNLDLNILRNKGIFNSISISAGTGYFSSIDSTVFEAEKKYNINKIQPNRSWTSIFGVKFEFPESLILNIEGYYKKVFDRMYVLVESGGDDNVKVYPFFNGEGIIWGIDVMLQKIQSRFWDGWLSYSYNWAKYRDPNGRMGGMGISGGNRGDDWYFTSYHRFHTLNLIFNYKPTQKINIYTRFGIASGSLIQKREGDKPVSYPVFVCKGNSGYFIEQFIWPSTIDENNRTPPSLPLDIKISFFGGNKNGKSRYEFYFAVENILGLLYINKGNQSFNSYTGEMNEGGFSASYDIPIPIPSFGFKISY